MISASKNIYDGKSLKPTAPKGLNPENPKDNQSAFTAMPYMA